MAPNEAPAVVIGGAYKESDDHVPNPTDVYGVVDTSGTAGIGDQRLEDVSPVFAVAKNQAIQDAAAALDPDRPDVPESLVTLPTGQPLTVVDTEAEKGRIRDLAANLTPVEIGGPSPSQQAAAEEDPGAREAQEIDAENKPAQGTDTAQTSDPAAAGAPAGTPRPPRGASKPS